MLSIDDSYFTVNVVWIDRCVFWAGCFLEPFVQFPGLFFLLSFIQVDAFLDTLGDQLSLFLGLRGPLVGFGQFQRFFLGLRRWFLVGFSAHRLLV